MKMNKKIFCFIALALIFLSQVSVFSYSIKKSSQPSPPPTSSSSSQPNVTPTQNYNQNIAGISIAFDNTLEKLDVESDGVTTDLKAINEVNNFKKFDFKEGNKITVTIGVMNIINPGVIFTINYKSGNVMKVLNSNNSIICDDSTAKMIPKFTENDLSGNFHPDSRWIVSQTLSKYNPTSFTCVIKL